MNIFLAANRTLCDEWRTTLFESRWEHTIQDVQRLAMMMNGAIPKEAVEEAATKIRGELAEARQAHLEKILKMGGAEESLTTGGASQLAIRFMQWALACLLWPRCY
jgi:hypothetical protein